MQGYCVLCTASRGHVCRQDALLVSKQRKKPSARRAASMLQSWKFSAMAVTTPVQLKLSSLPLKGIAETPLNCKARHHYAHGVPSTLKV